MKRVDFASSTLMIGSNTELQKGERCAFGLSIEYSLQVYEANATADYLMTRESHTCFREFRRQS